MKDVFFVPAELGTQVIDVHGHALPVIAWQVRTGGLQVDAKPVTPNGVTRPTTQSPLVIKWPDDTLSDLKDHSRYMSFMDWLDGPEPEPSDPPDLSYTDNIPI